MHMYSNFIGGGGIPLFPPMHKNKYTTNFVFTHITSATLYFYAGGGFLPPSYTKKIHHALASTM